MPLRIARRVNPPMVVIQTAGEPVDPQPIGAPAVVRAISR